MSGRSWGEMLPSYQVPVDVDIDVDDDVDDQVPIGVAKLSGPCWQHWHRSPEAIADPHSTSCSNHNKQITIYQQTSPHMGPVSAGQQAGKMAVLCNFFVKSRAFM